MAQCGICGDSILFGGKKLGGLRFCGEKCLQKGLLILAAREVPDEAVQRRIREVRSGQCPVCGGPGPVDVHTSYKI